MVQDKDKFALNMGINESSKVLPLTSSLGVIARTLKVYEQIVLVTLTAAYNMTITMPSVAAAKGLTYTIRVITLSGGSGVCYYTGAGDAVLSGDLIGEGDGICLRSDGYFWWTMATCT